MQTLLSESFVEQLGGRQALENRFPRIVSLNVSDNPMPDVKAMIDDILLLMPNVEDLQISLFKETDVDYIIQKMPKVQMLNNIAVEEDEENDRFECQESIQCTTDMQQVNDTFMASLATEIPENKISVNLDIANQHAIANENIALANAAGDRDTSVHMATSSSFKADHFSSNHTNSMQYQGTLKLTQESNQMLDQALNAECKAGGEEALTARTSSIQVDPSDMQDVTDIFEQLRKYKRTVGSTQNSNTQSCSACQSKNNRRKPNEKQLMKEDETLANEFQGFLQTVMDSLSNQLGKDLSDDEKCIEVLKSKFFLTDVCFEKAVDVLAQVFGKGPEKALVSLFTNLRNQICTSYVTMSQLKSSIQKDSSKVKTDFEEALTAKQFELDQALGRAADLEKSIDTKDKDWVKLETQVGEMQKMVTDLQAKIKMQNDANIEYKRDSEKQIEDLQVENLKLMDLIVKRQIYVAGRSTSGPRVSAQSGKNRDPRSLLKYSVSSKIVSRKALGKPTNLDLVMKTSRPGGGTTRMRNVDLKNLSPFLTKSLSQKVAPSSRGHSSNQQPSLLELNRGRLTPNILATAVNYDTTSRGVIPRSTSNFSGSRVIPKTSEILINRIGTFNATSRSNSQNTYHSNQNQKCRQLISPRGAQPTTQQNKSAIYYQSARQDGGAIGNSRTNHSQSLQVNSTSMKLHSLKQTKDLVCELVQAKHKYDEQCQTNRQPRETLEQFMFTFLNQRYGLRQLIVEWASSIVQAIKIYAPQDAQLQLFGKILKNSVDEDFWEVQEAMRGQLFKLVKVCYRERLQTKLLQDVHKHVEEVVQDRFGLDAWVQNRIIERLFSEADDQEEVKQRLAKLLQRKKTTIDNLLQKENMTSAKHCRSSRADFLKQTETVRLAFSEFVQGVLEFQLGKHEKFLDGFLKLFKSVDTNNDGVLNEEEFTLLIEKMKIGLTVEQTQAFLQYLDPYNQQKISFSDIIRLLSTQRTVAEENQSKEKKPAQQKQSQSFDDRRSHLSQPDVPLQHQESYNLRDSSMGLSDTIQNAIPLSEQVLNLGFFEKIADRQEKSFLSHQVSKVEGSKRFAQFELDGGQAHNRTNSSHD